MRVKLLLAATACLLLAGCAGGDDGALETLTQENLSLRQEIDDLEAVVVRLEAALVRENNELSQEIDRLEEALEHMQWVLSSWEAAQTVTPEEQRIIDDLMGRDDLIPFEGVLGGTPDWRVVQVLLSRQYENDGLVYAVADDGHIGGNGIFLFQIEADDSIAWRQVIWLS